MRGLLFIGAVAAVSALDCSTAAPWRSQIYPTSNTQVHHENKLYVNTYYAIETERPGDAGPWVLRGDCDAGTVGELIVDCNSFPEWSPQDFPTSTMVVYGDYTYLNQWYASSSEVPGEAGVWMQQGFCGGNGSAATQVPVSTQTATAAPATTNSCLLDQTTTTYRGTRLPVTPPLVTAPLPSATRWTPAPSVEPSTTTWFDKTTPYPNGEITWQDASSSLLPGLQTWPSQVFAPYMDVCLSARPDLASINSQTGTKFYVLAFMVGGDSCQPSWGGYYSLAQGPYSTFESDINTVRRLGGDVIVSLGGLLGPELADTAGCQGGNAVANIKKAYETIIDTYKLTHIDFDIEAAAISSGNRNTGWAYRFQALKQIQEERPYLRIWWTLPILPDGLTYDGQLFLQDLMKSGVRFDRFNVMTMDYGSYYSSGKTMHQCEQLAIDALASQMLSTATSLGLTSQYGWKSVSDVYPILGSTPMIGVNDVNTETYTLDDARNSLSVWKSAKPIGLLSEWSIARDIPCSGSWAQATCSSGNIQSKSYEFAGVFAQIHSA